MKKIVNSTGTDVLCGPERNNYLYLGAPFLVKLWSRLPQTNRKMIWVIVQPCTVAFLKPTWKPSDKKVSHKETYVRPVAASARPRPAHPRDSAGQVRKPGPATRDPRPCGGVHTRGPLLKQHFPLRCQNRAGDMPVTRFWHNYTV